MVIINIYSSNRRLYSTKDNKYINHTQLRKYIIDGLDVKIVHCPSGEDITAKILMKSLIDIGEELPIDTIRELIILSDKIIKRKGVEKTNNMLSIYGGKL